MLKSSANKLAFTGNVIVSTISLMAKRKSVTARDDPCGIPFSWQNVFDKVWDTLT
jgi:hypothetical protein